MAEPTLFAPGEQMTQIVPPRKSQPTTERVKIRFPGRIHITPIDLNRFDFGKPGAGGIGFAVDLENTLEVSLAGSDTVESAPVHQPLLAHYVRLMRTMTLWEGNIRVCAQVSPYMKQHSGLGSSISLATACVYALNVMFGNVLQPEEIRRLIAVNFVEVCGGKLARGLETGVGTAVLLDGSLAVIGDDIVRICSSTALDGLPVVLVFPRAPRPEMHLPESEGQFARSRELEASYRYVRAYRVLMEIVPALQRGDLRTVGDVIWDFQFSGCHIAILQAPYDGGVELMKALILLRKAGGTIVGVSSVGPTLFAVCADGVSRVIAAVTEAGLPNWVTAVASRGITVVS